MEPIVQEAREALRRLARTPGFTAAAVLTLALAIGANTAIFTLLHRVVVSPLPFPAAERLVALDHGAAGVGIPSNLGISTGLYREYGELPSVEAIALYNAGEATLTGEGEARRLELLRATPSLGGIVGARPALGRWLSEADGARGAPSVVLLSHGLWERSFGSSPGVVGRSIRIDGTPHEVIGVLPREFAFPDDRAELVLPLSVGPHNLSVGGFNFQGIARLRPAVSAEEFRRQTAGVLADLPARFPEQPELVGAMLGEARLASLAEPLKEHVLGDTARTLWILLAAVAVVLLIACANLANLFLVRAEGRQREVAVRRALGAGGARVALHFLVEMLLVALASGAIGLLLGQLAIEALVANRPVDLPRLHEVRLDGAAVAFAALASLVAGLSFGLMPLVRRGPALASVLQDSGRGNTAGGSRMRARQALMGGQVALAVVLLVAAGLMVQSFQRLRAVDPGFAAESRLVFHVGLSTTDYPTRDHAAAFYEAVIERVRGLPGVRSAALVSDLPLDRVGSGDPVEVRGRPLRPGEVGPIAAFRLVSPDYFSTMEIPLLRGRALEPPDPGGETGAVVVNEALAALYFPGEDPIGRQIRPIGQEGDDAWLTVVGVVGNTTHLDLRESSPTPKLYVPLRQPRVGYPYRGTFVVRTEGNPVALVPGVRREIAGLDPGVAVSRPERLTDVIARAGAGLAFTMVLIALAASVALLLGLVGVYAVISYGVSQRRGEIGVRLALGAHPGEVTRMILRQSGGVVAAGVALGLGAAALSSRLLRSLLFDVSASDPLTYAGVGAALFAVAMIACWLPARRASRLDPLNALRSE